MTASPPAVRTRSALAGVAAGLVLVAVAELASLLFSASSAPFVAVGGAFVDLIPGALKDVVVALFGTADKLVLFLCMGVVHLALTAGIGLLGTRRIGDAVLALTALGVLAAVVVMTRPENAPASMLPTLLGTAVGAPALLLLLRGAAREREPGDGAGRRDLLVSGAVAIGAVLLGAGARVVNAGRSAAEAAARRFTIPTPTAPAPAVPASAQVTLEGMPDVVTTNTDFYRIDTALAVPRVDPSTWSLRIVGLVDQELTLSFEELLAEPAIETTVTLTCVSNTVGGDLAGNARWIGVPVRTLLARAGVQDGADMVLSRSVDGFTASTPLEALTDDRDAILAVAMNGEALPPEHGYPVRMVVPGLYGYVSATKWVEGLTVTRFADATAYWTDRGWSEKGPIKTASRIDVPRDGARVRADDAGAVTLGGTAWAQHRGVNGVQVQLDDDPWQDATLATAISGDTWVQWSLNWADATPGEHTARVRATDGTGELQTSKVASPAPDGASGWHEVSFTVR
ncbi:oxidoreductase [Brachybacterium sp. SGAir0954]|uniref:molybdopterin-dependent oxidoreductase n=1 Tax=Brachybacterium sp. SGAir0954 TaxID=2571029 RepID=UPI0010CCD412|nr:molybdopterin-dependent oxidoreductase [Brachybacterium sp. SGAir0954]QCR52608.1 oxidoreductase [Brachybacterium sp. SGAir0954]